MRAAVLVIVAAWLGGCVSTPEEIRAADPAMVATFPQRAGASHECLTQVWESTRIFRFDPPVRVQARYAEQRGMIAVETLEQLGITSWLIDVVDAPSGSRATAWSQRMVSADMQAELSVRMIAAVNRCGGVVTDNRIEPPKGRSMGPTDR